MSFQIPGNNTPPTGGFSFGAPNTSASTAQPAAVKPSGFTFGATGGGDAGTKTFGFSATAVTGATTPVTSTTTIVGSGVAQTGFGASVPASTSPATQPAITSTPQPAAAAFAFSTAPTQTSATTVASTTTANTSATATSTSSLSSGFSAFATPATNTSVASAVTGAAPTTTTLLTSQAATSSVSTSGFASLSTATKTTDSNAMPPCASQLSYNQLEEHINKWTLELEEQEKIFTDQATQINAWDKILISNNQKIVDLNDAVQKVKSDQQTLEQELEFIATQHKELEESVVPLQKEFMKIPQVDVERSQTYLMVENLDTQLKQMSEDLKEIIDNLNESNKCQDNSDPIIQIGKILNAHMSSLQWIEQSSSSIGSKLEDITKMHETFKRDSERSFRSAYYN